MYRYICVNNFKLIGINNEKEINLPKKNIEAVTDVKELIWLPA